MHEGHRQRMFERLKNNSELQDHELLEILLYFCIPRRNTNEIAHELLSSFGGIREVFRADFRKLTAVNGVGAGTAEFLLSVGKTMERILAYREKDLPSAYNFESFSSFLSQRFQFVSQEYAELYSVKKTGEVLFCQRFTSDEADSVRIPSYEIAKFITAFQPKEVILVHNHIVNNCNPSESDDRFTRFLCMTFSLYNIKLLDHYIVSPTGLYSYFIHGRMDEIREKFGPGAVRSLLS